MRISKIFLATAAASLATTPVLAAAVNPAGKLSVAKVASKSVRTGTAAKRSNRAISGITIGVIAAAAIIAGIVIVADGDEDAASS